MITNTYINTYMHTSIHTYIHKYLHTYIHTYIHTYSLLYSNLYLCTYVYTYRERTISIAAQSSITKDNVHVEVSGNLYCQFNSAEKAAYGDYKNTYIWYIHIYHIYVK